MKAITVEPVRGEDYKGRQWGYHLCRDGVALFRVTAGGTGTCWNVDTLDSDPDETPLHVCELDDLIDALVALRDSDAHREHVARWSR